MHPADSIPLFNAFRHTDPGHIKDILKKEDHGDGLYDPSAILFVISSFTMHFPVYRSAGPDLIIGQAQPGPAYPQAPSYTCSISSESMSSARLSLTAIPLFSSASVWVMMSKRSTPSLNSAADSCSLSPELSSGAVTTAVTA